MTGALLVNPYDHKAFALTIKKALEMPEEEAGSRFQKLLSFVSSHTTFDWAKGFFKVPA